MIALKEVYENGEAQVGQRFVFKRNVGEVTGPSLRKDDQAVLIHKSVFTLTNVYDDGMACELTYRRIDDEECTIAIPYCGAGEIREYGVRNFIAMNDLFLLNGRAQIAMSSRAALRKIK